MLNDQGVAIYRLPLPDFKFGKFLFNIKNINSKIKEIHLQNKIDIVEAAEMGLVFINKIPSVKYVIRLHGGHHFFAESENRKIHWRQGLKEKMSFKKADGFIAVSEFVKSHTQKYLSYNNKPISVINYPIDTDLFSPRPDVAIDENNITFAGTICEKKGIRQLIEAMAILTKKYPKLKLHVYGRDWFYNDGRSYTQMLKSKYRKFIDSSVIFHGVIPFNDLPKKYATAKICVFPSHMETQGLVAPEAMAMKKPVIFSMLGPGPETVENFKTGLLCNPHDVNDISEKIEWFINNPDKIELIGDSARDFVIKRYGIDKILNENLEFYKNLET